jgi:beta-phosphoglucomutase-like phosphatase (HAD superfamily)
MFAKGKPAPDCYLLGAEVFQIDIKNCVVFEDSFHGLEAGRSAGMKVVGLATTNPKEKIAHLSDIVIEDFTQFDINNMMDLIQN